MATVSAAMMKNFKPGERNPRALGFGILSFGNKPSHGAKWQGHRGSWRNRGTSVSVPRYIARHDDPTCSKIHAVSMG